MRTQLNTELSPKNVNRETTDPAKFGTVLGIAPGGVPVYSCDYDSADDNELPNRQAYRSVVDDIYMGHKWQCVEFARRWLYFNRGYVFDDVPMAYDIFRLRSVRVIDDGTRLPLHSFSNGSKRHPEPGCLLIWDEGGEFETTGHVAIVTEVTPEYVRFVEQNVRNQVWPDGRNYSREIKAKVSDDGQYWLECSFGDATILGWVIQTDDDAHAEEIDQPDRQLFKLEIRELIPGSDSDREWLNIANPDEAAYVELMEGHLLNDEPCNQHRYLRLSETALSELERATNELHALFLHATDYVLRDDERLRRFCIPSCLWPKIHQSWDNRRNEMITGRFDFALTELGLKAYEYNCDSASCHMECGKVQGKWAKHFDCDDGIDPGSELQQELFKAWRNRKVDGVLHIMQDRDLEETYHALFFQDIIERAGIQTKIIRGVSGLDWSPDGGIVDSDGVPIKWVWKTWAWESALDQIRAECDDDEEKLRDYQPGQRHDGPVRLVDVLLRKNVMVFEPLWTLIPSNKAILPVLWSMFPDHPYLLETAFQLTDSLRKAGYVSKPIVGRGGANISIVNRRAHVVAETAGDFENRDHIYQELFRLPVLEGYNAQISTFTASGKYAGTCVRIDRSPVITNDSDCLALRVVDDDELGEN